MKRVFVSLSLIFITQSVFADFMCEDATDYYAIYKPNSYTCNSGQYLPANALGCVSCPNGFTCPGGTFDFNADYFQGLDITSVPNSTMNNICANNFPGDLMAVYEPNQYTCSAGYYLPADGIACTICPKDNYCGGGTYTFNETTQQGITPCSGTTPYAPAGSAVCYPRMMHLSDERPEDVIYLKSTETTTPAFHVNINGTTYHANMTTTPTYMTAASEHYLKIMVDNVEYYVCDDTTYTAE